MKIEDSFRIVERKYGNGNVQYFVQEYHVDYEWQDTRMHGFFKNLNEAKEYKKVLIQWEKNALVVSEKVVG